MEFFCIMFHFTFNSHHLHEHAECRRITDTYGIVVFHQDIYGSGYDHSDSDGMVLRTQLTPLMDKYKICLLYTSLLEKREALSDCTRVVLVGSQPGMRQPVALGMDLSLIHI